MVWLATLAAMWLWLGSSQQHSIALAAGPSNSETFELTTAIATVLNTENDRFDIDVFETGGSSENLRLLEAGRIDIGTIQADVAIPEGIVALAKLYHDAYHLVVNEDAAITHFADLKGHRVAIPPLASGQNDSFWFLAEHYGLRPDDLVALPMSEDAANFAMIQGQVDAVFRVRAPGNDSIRRLIGDHAMMIVPIGQSEALSLKQPALSSGIIPHGSYRGYPSLPEEDLPTAVLDRLLVVREDMPAELAYRFVREMFERRSDIVAVSNLGGLIGPLDTDAESHIPAHPGARRYYDREKPGFVRQNARLASTGLYALVLLSSALLALRSHWMRTRRIRMGDFNRRLMKIAETARATDGHAELLGSKNQLMDILTEVVTDLDHDRVSQDEFEHFSFTWQAVDALVRDRMAMITKPHGEDTVGVTA